MYKVFIDNKPIIFQINLENEYSVNREKVWQKIHAFLTSEVAELTINIASKADFDFIFEDYKWIEAAGGLVQRDDAFLFIKRNGIWDIPKGKLEQGETPEVGAIREIEEECGLVAPVIKMHLLDTWHTYFHKGKDVLKRTYWYWLDEGEARAQLVPQTEEGITELDYFEPEKWGEIRGATYCSILEVMDALEKKMN